METTKCCLLFAEPDEVPPVVVPWEVLDPEEVLELPFVLAFDTL